MRKLIRYCFLIVLLLPLLAAHGQQIMTGGNRKIGAAPIVMGIVQSCMGGDPSYSCTMPGSVTAGNILIFFSFNNNMYANVDSVHDDTLCGIASKWTRFQSSQPEMYMGLGLFGCVAPTSGAETISITPATASHFLVMEISGIAAASPFDTSSAFTDSYVSTTVSNTITTAVAGEFVIVCQAYEYGVTTVTANNGFTWLAGNGTVGAFRPWNCFGKTTTTAGAYGVTLTNDNPSQERGFASTMLAIKPH